MSGKFLLDTNILIALFANDENVLAQLESVKEVFIPSIVLGELYYGASKSARSQTNIARIDEFVTANQILVIDSETARYYGQIKNSLQIKGKPIPENDIWIAALSCQYQYPLVTYDHHFGEVEGIEILRW